MYITIRKEVQTRHCSISVHLDGSASLTAFADDQPYITAFAFGSLAQARDHAETVQLGGVTHWSLQGSGSSGSTWASDRVLCFNGGVRLNADELDLVRKQNRKRVSA